MPSFQFTPQPVQQITFTAPTSSAITFVTQQQNVTLTQQDAAPITVLGPAQGPKGKDGTNGIDGFTPIKGVDYFDGTNGTDGVDGYTPIKGVDYFDGTNGVDGYTPIKGVDYVDGQDSTVPGPAGYTPIKGVDYFDGEDGAGLPTGGAPDQILTKKSPANYDYEWKTPVAGVTDHGMLSGLTDDDHTQYLNNTRGDTRYYQKSEVDTQLANKSPTSHNHDSTYAPIIHTHPIADIAATGGTTASFLKKDGTWATPTDTTYTEITEAEITTGTASTLRTITARRLKFLFDSIISHVQANVFLWTHPVGSIFTTTVATNPGTLFGGTWVAFAEGRAIVGKAPSGTFSVAGDTVGSETHTLTAAEIPNLAIGANRYDGLGLSNMGVASGSSAQGILASGSPAANRLLGSTTNTGGTAHNNVQPSVIAYIWRRTA